ncbi:kinesin light chain protein, partial [Colletotrichum salicis]
MSDPQAYTVGWICALPTELAAARTFLDEQHPAPKAVQRNDNNAYTLGTMGNHNVVIAVMPKKEYGIAAAATVAKDLVHSFPNVRIGLMVGVGGGAPSLQHDIRLGDIVVGSRDAGKGGVVQFDYGKMMQNQGFVETGSLNQPPPALLNAVAGLETEYMMQGPELDAKVQQALTLWKRLQRTHSRPAGSTDRLYKSDFTHPLNSSVACCQASDANTANVVSRDERGEDEDNPAIHYGLIASANQVMKNAEIRDKLSEERGVLCFEMEAAGLMNHFPCLVIRGICDYSDSHKNKEWQGFAAMVAAAYAKDLLLQIPLNSVEAEKPVLEGLNTIHEGLYGLKQIADDTKVAVETMHSDHTILLYGLQQGVQNLKRGNAEDLSVARSPHFIVPFPSDPNFVNRSDIWTWMEVQYAGPGIRFALVGFGGFGKSQMAIQLAHHVHASTPDTSIFWVRGSTKATFEESYRSIADGLALPRRHESGVNVLSLVRQWLQTKDVRPWLMIVDNVDDIETLFSKMDGHEVAPMPIASYLPKSNNGKILFTSRSWDVAERLTGNGKMILRVPTMDEAQALLLFQKKVGQDIDKAGAMRLVHRLDHIPLAVNQAAAYIHKRSPRVTVRSYLDEFERSEKRKGTLLRSDRGDIRRYDGLSNSVIVTWQVTFEQIKREKPRAANLLSLMSYFHAQNIPQYMLHDYNSNIVDEGESDDDDDSGNDSDDSDDSDNGKFEDDLDLLQGYSLVAMTATSGF